MILPRIHQVCLCYVAALIAHVLQSVACNALHTVEARLACWLLLFQDRVNGIIWGSPTRFHLAGAAAPR